MRIIKRKLFYIFLFSLIAWIPEISIKAQDIAADSAAIIVGAIKFEFVT